jgi:nucleoside-diphosphate-sugar epimerase
MALENTTILITGGCGQVGLAITQYLQTHHLTAKLYVLDLSSPAIPSPNVTYHIGSITDASTVSSIFTLIKPQVVFHTAGLIPSIAERLGLNTEKNFREVNVEGTMIVLEKAREVGVKAFVYTSSADVVKGDSWQDLRGVDEEMAVPEKFDSAYGKSKVGFCAFFSGRVLPSERFISVRRSFRSPVLLCSCTAVYLTIERVSDSCSRAEVSHPTPSRTLTSCSQTLD